jgi:hypothetical protein
MMSSPRDDKEGYHSPTHHSAHSLGGGVEGATVDIDDNEATGTSASLALAKNSESSYVMTLTPGWRRVDGVNKKAVTFASDVKEGSVITVTKEENDDSAIGWGEYETPNRLAFICNDMNEGSALAFGQENESSSMGEEDERKEGTTTGMVKKDSGRSMDDLAMTDERMLEGSTDSNEPDPVMASVVKEGGDITVKYENEDSAIGWGEYETPNRLAFICNNEDSALAFEQENESSSMGKENERKEGTTVTVDEEDSGLNIDDLAMTDGGMIEGSADCNEPDPLMVVVPTTLSTPPVEEDEPRSKKGLALLLLILVVSIITILIIVLFR